MSPESQRLLPVQVHLLTLLSVFAFASNSLLCRLALRHSAIDAASFTSVRLVTGAIVLAVIVRLRRGEEARFAGDWPSAIALFIYAAGFSWAYLSLPAATGALLLFGAVQITMIGYGLWRGERLKPMQTVGLLAACAGLAAMLLPGIHAPPWHGSLLMVCAGVAWGAYSLRGRGSGNPLAVTAGNFLRASVLAVVMSATLLQSAQLDVPGVSYALASGGLASGVGYAIWYTAIRSLAATSAATVQLSVPVIAALGAVALLGEPITVHLAATSLVILGGVALVIVTQHRTEVSRN